MTKFIKTGPLPPHGIERRRSHRRPMMATFSIFVVIPKKGLHRLKVHDISELGMKFDLDIEGESPESFPTEPGNTIDFRFYLNTSLYIPLTIQVVRVESNHVGRRLGAEFQETSSPSYKAFVAFLQLLDSMIDIIQLDSALP